MHRYVPFPEKEGLKYSETPTDRILPHISQWHIVPGPKNIPELFMIQVLSLRYQRVSLSNTCIRDFVSY